MKTEEMLKQKIVDARMELAMLMNFASQKMDDSSFNLLESKIKQIHIYDLNKDFEMSLSETRKLIKELREHDYE